MKSVKETSDLTIPKAAFDALREHVGHRDLYLSDLGDRIQLVCWARTHGGEHHVLITLKEHHANP
jgi:hypothetical protein